MLGHRCPHCEQRVGRIAAYCPACGGALGPDDANLRFDPIVGGSTSSGVMFVDLDGGAAAGTVDVGGRRGRGALVAVASVGVLLLGLLVFGRGDSGGGDAVPTTVAAPTSTSTAPSTTTGPSTSTPDPSTTSVQELGPLLDTATGIRLLVRNLAGFALVNLDSGHVESQPYADRSRGQTTSILRVGSSSVAMNWANNGPEVVVVPDGGQPVRIRGNDIWPSAQRDRFWVLTQEERSEVRLFDETGTAVSEAVALPQILDGFSAMGDQLAISIAGGVYAFDPASGDVRYLAAGRLLDYGGGSRSTTVRVLSCDRSLRCHVSAIDAQGRELWRGNDLSPDGFDTVFSSTMSMSPDGRYVMNIPFDGTPVSLADGGDVVWTTHSAADDQRPSGNGSTPVQWTADSRAAVWVSNAGNVVVWRAGTREPTVIKALSQVQVLDIVRD